MDHADEQEDDVRVTGLFVLVNLTCATQPAQGSRTSGSSATVSVWRARPRLQARDSYNC
jgi:hypothetical protein